jgi:hypothetical protein
MSKLVFSDKLKGSCDKCHGVVTGGYLSLDENGTVTGMICKECHQNTSVETSKTVAISVKKLQGSFMQFVLKQEFYQVLASKNIILKSELLTEEELNRFIANPNVSVTIKH